VCCSNTEEGRHGMLPRVDHTSSLLIRLRHQMPKNTHGKENAAIMTQASQAIACNTLQLTWPDGLLHDPIHYPCSYVAALELTTLLPDNPETKPWPPIMRPHFLHRIQTPPVCYISCAHTNTHTHTPGRTSPGPGSCTR
jgi:hypothetical protein